MLQDLKTNLQSGNIRLNDALGRALPEFRGKISDERLVWLVNEYQGYPNALDWYQRPSDEFPPYRVVSGYLQFVDKDGNYGELKHPLAKKEQFFIAAPISWLEESASMQGPEALVEMQELNSHFKAAGGGVVCFTTQEQITRILNSFRASFIALIDEVSAKAKP